MVQVFTHLDLGAPQIAETVGAINTVLEWSLTQVGWTIPFRDDANKIMCFQSGDPASTGAVFQFDDSNTGYAVCKGYESMSSVTEGNNSFYHVGTVGKYDASGGWYVVADSLAFYLVIMKSDGKSYFSFNGDIIPLSSVDNACALTISSPVENGGMSLSGTGGKRILANASRDTYNIHVKIQTASPSFGSERFSSSLSGKKEFYECFANHDYQNRGVIPGLFMCACEYDESGVVLSGIDGLGSESVLLLKTPSYYQSFGINLTSWGRG